jgi:hypothetical protein
MKKTTCKQQLGEKLLIVVTEAREHLAHTQLTRGLSDRRQTPQKLKQQPNTNK